MTSFTVSNSFYYWPPISSSHKMVTFCLWPFWGLSLDQIVGPPEFNNVLFLIEPTILVSLILAIQELSCPLFCSLLYFYAKYTDLKNIVRCHSTGLVQSKLGMFSPDRRLSRPNPDPQGLPCLTCVQPNLTCPIHSPGIQSLDTCCLDVETCLMYFNSLIICRWCRNEPTGPEWARPIGVREATVIGELPVSEDRPDIKHRTVTKEPDIKHPDIKHLDIRHRTDTKKPVFKPLEISSLDMSDPDTVEELLSEDDTEEPGNFLKSLNQYFRGGRPRFPPYLKNQCFSMYPFFLMFSLLICVIITMSLPNLLRKPLKQCMLVS